MPLKFNNQQYEYLTPRQVADCLKISPVTVRHWAVSGKLKFVTTPGGHRRFSYADIEQFAQERGIRLSWDDAGTLRVLIVDDNVELSGYLVEVLKGAELDLMVEVAHDGYAAGEQVHLFKPDIVLLDLMMPGMNGFDTCRRIKQNVATRHIRVIAMTGFPTEENIERIMNAGAEQCLAKPIRAFTLLQTMGIDAEPPAAEGEQLPTANNPDAN